MAEPGPHELSGGRDERSLAGAIRELIFGAEDGLVSILGLVTGVAAGTTSSAVVLLAGSAGAISGAISMAAGNYLGVKSQIEVLERRLREEERSIREQPEHERAELEAYYREHGLSPEERETIIPAVERSEDLLMEEMAAHELGISPSELRNPVWKAVWIFVAYIIAAVFPVLPYALFPRETALPVSIIGTVLALFGVGAAKTVYTGRNPVRSGLEMLVIALLAGIAGFLAGHFIAPAV
jgi:VIT1/CCC1 family predicted Fe2+/Mn2+ transporter